MPIYQYTDGDVVFEEWRPVAQRDVCPPNFRRIQVPERIGFVGGLAGRAGIDPTCADASVPKALREYELTKGHDAIARETGFSTRRMKQIWDI